MIASVRLEQTQSLKQTQTLKMTVQMRQSIELLQKNILDIRDFLIAEAEQNPFLEIESYGDEPEPFSGSGKDGDLQDIDYSNDNSEVKELMSGDSSENISDILSQCDWGQLRDTSGNSFGDTHVRKQNYSDLDFSFENNLVSEETLPQYLDRQIVSLDLSDKIRELMVYMAYNLDERGFLKESDEELSKNISTNIKDVAQARKELRKCDPAGCGSQNIYDYLIYMLVDPCVIEIPEKYTGHIKKLFLDVSIRDLLEKKDFNSLCEVLEVTEEELREILSVIKVISPYPAFRYSQFKPEFVQPDLKVFMEGDEILIHIEDRLLPTVNLNKETFDQKLKECKNRKEKSYMKERYRNAEWIIKSVSDRNRTLYEVAASIFTHQKTFIELGENFLKPLSLKDVSEDIGRNASTISRLTNGKYAETPHGIFELKYFFAKQVSDNLATNRRLEASIREIIENEPKEAPFSDDDISIQLSRKGIDVARRTVAKYRTRMKIPSAKDRKKNYNFSSGG
jgi:RNA polymerase sigma-54 factor